jgi:hypothetical protein
VAKIDVAWVVWNRGRDYGCRWVGWKEVMDQGGGRGWIIDSKGGGYWIKGGDRVRSVLRQRRGCRGLGSLTGTRVVVVGTRLQGWSKVGYGDVSAMD